jgi:hypothetical protein
LRRGHFMSEGSETAFRQVAANDPAQQPGTSASGPQADCPLLISELEKAVTTLDEM